MYDLPSILLLRNIIFIIDVVSGKVIPQYTSLKNIDSITPSDWYKIMRILFRK